MSCNKFYHSFSLVFGYFPPIQAQYLFIYKCLLHEYLYGETEVTKDTIKDHFDSLLETFPDTEDSRMEKEFQVCGT